MFRLFDCLLLQRTLCLRPTNCYCKLLKRLMAQTSTQTVSAVTLTAAGWVMDQMWTVLAAWHWKYDVMNYIWTGQLRAFHSPESRTAPLCCSSKPKVTKIYIHIHNCCSSDVFPEAKVLRIKFGCGLYSNNWSWHKLQAAMFFITWYVWCTEVRNDTTPTFNVTPQTVKHTAGLHQRLVCLKLFI